MRPLAPFALWLLAVAGCAHHSPAAATTTLLRLHHQVGQPERGRLQLLIELDTLGRQGSGVASTAHVGLRLHGTDERLVESVDKAGDATVKARLQDVVGEAAGGTSQDAVDAWARALDTMRVRYHVSEKGEATDLALKDLVPPLEEGAARPLAQAIYHVARGPLLPDGPVAVGSRWTIETPLSPGLGLDGRALHRYSVAELQNGVAVLRGETAVDGKGSGVSGITRRIQGRGTSEYRVDVASGRVLSSRVDITTQVEQVIPGVQTLEAGVRQHLRVEWRRP